MIGSTASNGRRLASTVGVASALVLVALAGAIFPAGSAAAAVPATAPAAGTSTQWAFGGSVQSDFSCSNSTCVTDGLNLTNGSLAVSWSLYVEWVVIYTATNVSASQTEFSVQSALNVSASFALWTCEVLVSGHPCSPNSTSLSVSGKETANGYTNVTSGSLYLLSGPNAGSTVPALAVTNASSSSSFNLSGSFGLDLSYVTGSGTVPIRESGSFDVGASAGASISFADPLALVPTDPGPGNSWNASEAYTASGSNESGYSATVTENGTTGTVSDWSPKTTIAPSGTLVANGSDLGNVTLYDNYTSPPTTVTAQVISITFTSGDFSGTDGWLLFPTELYSGLVSGASTLGAAGPLAPAAGRPAETLSIAGGETADYVHGSGFVGVSEGGNVSSIVNGTGGPSIKLQAGPEPVSVAQGQYSAITASAPGAKGLPLLLLGGIVAAAVVVAGVGVVLWRRSAARRRPPAGSPPPAAGGSSPPPPMTGPGTGPSP